MCDLKQGCADDEEYYVQLKNVQNEIDTLLSILDDEKLDRQVAKEVSIFSVKNVEEQVINRFHREEAWTEVKRNKHSYEEYAEKCDDCLYSESDCEIFRFIGSEIYVCDACRNSHRREDILVDMIVVNIGWGCNIQLCYQTI